MAKGDKRVKLKMRSILMLSLMFSMPYQVEPFSGPVIKDIIKRLLYTKTMTRHRAVPNDFGKYPLIPSKQRQSLVDTDAFRRTTTTPVPVTAFFGKPILVPKTDGFGGQVITDGPVEIVSVTTPSKTKHNSPTPVPKTDSGESYMYVYIAVGAATFLLITAAVLLLFVWVMKRKNQRQVENAEICET